MGVHNSKKLKGGDITVDITSENAVTVHITTTSWKFDTKSGAITAVGSGT
ncbi:MAG: hypothetical protein MR930_07070 [Lachnospiraceae bacterium]|nr:hypothetical protein [Lachnospiraceae bacterium]